MNVDWKKISVTDSMTYWIWGIYKIVSYRPGEYYAYFIQDHQKNWGDHPEPPPARSKVIQGQGCWQSFASARRCCERHSITHTPAPRTVARAEELLAEYLEKEEACTETRNSDCA